MTTKQISTAGRRRLYKPVFETRLNTPFVRINRLKPKNKAGICSFVYPPDIEES